MFRYVEIANYQDEIQPDPVAIDQQFTLFLPNRTVTTAEAQLGLNGVDTMLIKTLATAIDLEIPGMEVALPVTIETLPTDPGMGDAFYNYFNPFNGLGYTPTKEDLNPFPRRKKILDLAGSFAFLEGKTHLDVQIRCEDLASRGLMRTKLEHYVGVRKNFSYPTYSFEDPSIEALIKSLRLTLFFPKGLVLETTQENDGYVDDGAGFEYSYFYPQKLGPLAEIKTRQIYAYKGQELLFPQAGEADNEVVSVQGVFTLPR